VKVELVPDGDPGTLASVRAALDALRLLDEQRALAYGSEWRRHALADSVERDPGYVPSPRSSRGATRA
jgi:hypothetical protein